MVTAIRHLKSIVPLFILVILFGFALDKVEEIAVLPFEQVSSKSQIDNLNWKWNLSEFKEGHYYLSAGRVRGPCEIKIDGNSIAKSGSSIDGLIQSLTLGESITVTKRESRTVTISCDKSLGFATGLADKPFLINYYLGISLQFFRIILQLLIGPAVCMFLLASSLLYLSRKESGLGVFDYNFNRAVLVFAVVGFAYTLSLDRMPRLFFSNYSSTLIHILLRSAYAWAFTEITYCISNTQSPLRGAFLFLMVSNLIVGILSPAYLVLMYKYQFPIYIITTGICAVHLIKKHEDSGARKWLLDIATIWTFTQCYDCIANFLDLGTFKSPIIVVLITIGIEIVRKKEVATAQRIEMSVERILSAIKRRTSLFSTLNEIGHLIGQETHFRRRSVYLDAYCLGRSTAPNEIGVRVMEFGYQKDTVDDQEIRFTENRGLLMRKAMDSGSLLQSKGQIEDAFVIIPIGKLACINLSDEIESNPNYIYESMAVIKRLLAPLAALEQRILEVAKAEDSLLAKIKAIKGFGTFPLKMGAIFVDVVDFSKQVSHYKLLSQGDDPFGAFVVGKYLPALTRAVSDSAHLADTEGDKAFYLVLKEFLPDNESCLAATAKTVRKIMTFMNEEGASICAGVGFPAIKIRIGANFGNCTLICDESRVRAAGETINFAARMLDLAPAGLCLASPELANEIENDNFSLGQVREILEKKDIVQAQLITYRLTDLDAA